MPAKRKAASAETAGSAARPGSFEPHTLIRPGRPITGMSAVLLPYDTWHRPDWASFDRLLERTAEAGLVPAVNMDTGYATLLTPTEREWVLDRTRIVLGEGGWIAGAYHRDTPKARFDGDAITAQVEQVQRYGGRAIVFPNYGLATLDGDALVAAYERFGAAGDGFYAFELGTDFVPFGRIFDLDVYRALMGIPTCLGAKHSSLSRQLEWDRLRLRDEVRPDFLVLTGNDLAIDMVTYGSDYLLGLAAFAPDRFAERDRLWAAGDPAFYELNDALQALGSFAFRPQVPAYRAQCAQFLKGRGWITTDVTHRRAHQRPAHDIHVLKALATRLDIELTT